MDLINELRARQVLKTVETDARGESQGTTAILTSDLSSREVLFENAIQAEYVGKSLDYLTKQLVRLREERRIAAMVKLAERTRRIREAEESGRRQQELLRQREQDEIFKQTMSVHQETVESYLEQVLGATCGETAKSQAEAKAREYYIEMEKLRASIKKESTLDDQEYDRQIVSDLISSFLIPYVEKSVMRGLVENSQQQYLVAAHEAVYQNMHNIESSQPSSSSSSGAAAEKINESELPPLPK